MTIAIADNSPRVSYSVSEGATQTSFAVPFEFFADADLNFIVDGTTKTLTTHYTVSGGSGSTGTVTTTSGNTITGATGGSTVVITRDIALERTTDFPSSGPFQIGALNTELDRLTAIAADLDDKAGRALQVTDYDVATGLTLPEVNDRKGKTLTTRRNPSPRHRVHPGRGLDQRMPCLRRSCTRRCPPRPSHQ